MVVAVHCAHLRLNQGSAVGWGGGNRGQCTGPNVRSAVGTGAGDRNGLLGAAALGDSGRVTARGKGGGGTATRYGRRIVRVAQGRRGGGGGGGVWWKCD